MLTDDIACNGALIASQPTPDADWMHPLTLLSKAAVLYQTYMQDSIAAGSPRSGSASPDDKATHVASQQQQHQQCQPAVLYIKGQQDSHDKPVSAVYRQAAYIQQPEKSGRSSIKLPAGSVEKCTQASLFKGAICCGSVWADRQTITKQQLYCI